jgi:hypothetical protein
MVRWTLHTRCNTQGGGCHSKVCAAGGERLWNLWISNPLPPILFHQEWLGGGTRVGIYRLAHPRLYTRCLFNTRSTFRCAPCHLPRLGCDALLTLIASSGSLILVLSHPKPAPCPRPLSGHTKGGCGVSLFCCTSLIPQPASRQWPGMQGCTAVAPGNTVALMGLCSLYKP